MGLKEWAINLMLCGLVANAFLFVLITDKYPDSSLFACTKEIFESSGNDFEQYFPTDRMIGSCKVKFADAPNFQAVISSTDLLKQILGILFAIPGLALYIINLLVIAIYLILNLLLTGWLNIYLVLFGGITETVGSMFFGIAILLTGVQFFGLIEYILDMVAKMQGSG